MMMPRDGPMLLSDFNIAKLGPGPHSGMAEPYEYRAPEILLDMERSYPLDIWTVGLTGFFGSVALYILSN